MAPVVAILAKNYSHRKNCQQKRQFMNVTNRDMGHSFR